MTPALVFLCEVCEFFSGHLFCRHLRTAASATENGVSITAFEQVNTSGVLRASFTDKTKAFFDLLKSNANSETIRHVRWEISA